MTRNACAEALAWLSVALYLAGCWLLVELVAPPHPLAALWVPVGATGTWLTVYAGERWL